MSGLSGPPHPTTHPPGAFRRPEATRTLFATYADAAAIGGHQLARRVADQIIGHLHDDAPTQIDQLATIAALRDRLADWLPITIHKALQAGASVEDIGAAVEMRPHEVLHRWRMWADGQKQLNADRPGLGMDPGEYDQVAEIIRRAEAKLPPPPPDDLPEAYARKRRETTRHYLREVRNLTAQVDADPHNPALWIRLSDAARDGHDSANHMVAIEQAKAPICSAHGPMIRTGKRTAPLAADGNRWTCADHSSCSARYWWLDGTYFARSHR